MKTYTIYIGRSRVDQFVAETLDEATKRWGEICEGIEAAGTCVLYDGKRGIENECARQVIGHSRHNVESRHAGKDAPI